MASSPRRLPWALLVSGVCHAVVLALALVPRTAASSEPTPPPDRWTDSSAGSVTELLPAELLDSPSESAAAQPAAAQPASEAPAAEPTPADAPRAPAPAPRSGEKPAPGEAGTRKPSSPTARKPSAPVTKDSLHEADATRVDPPREPTPEKSEPDARTEPRAARQAAKIVGKPEAPGRAVRVPANRAPPGSTGSAGGSDSTGGTTSAGASVGQVGPVTVRDLGQAFTRAIAPAGQPDRAWAELPAGPVGVAEVALDVSAEGKLEGVTPLGKDASAPLVKLARQVVVILRSGFFTLRGPDPSAGRQVLRLRATASDVPTDVRGGAAALSFTYDAGKGTSTFTQANGRRVEVRVELVRVDPR